MRWLMAAVIGMGILIVAGVTVLVVVLIQRMSSVSTPIASAVPVMEAHGSPAVSIATLDEPAGTRIMSAAAAADRVAVVLGGGGPDRVVIVDTRLGRVVARVALGR